MPLLVAAGAAPDDLGRKIRAVDLDDDGADDRVVGAAYDRTYDASAGSVPLMAGPSGTRLERALARGVPEAQ